MKPIYLFILSLVPSLIVSQEINLNTPSEITLEFIKDFKKWNDFAYNLSLEKSDNDELMELEYKKIILAKLTTGEWQMQYEKLRATLSEASAEKLMALGATVQKNLPW